MALFGGDGVDSRAFLQYHEAYKKDKLRWKKGLEWEDDLEDSLRLRLRWGNF